MFYKRAIYSGLLAAFGFAGAAFAGPPADGQLDTSFSGDGKELIAFDVESPNFMLDMALDTVADSFGRTYVVGAVTTPNGQRIGITRLKADGSVDDIYGPNGDGLVVAPEQMGFNLTGVSAALDNQGFLLVAGTLNQNGNNDFAVCRFNVGGALAVFTGSNLTCGSVGFDLSPQANADVLRDIVVQADGKIVMIGTATANIAPLIIEMAIARLNPDASLDADFGNNGKFFFLPNGYVQTTMKAAAVMDTGKIVLVGECREEPDFDTESCAARLTSTGTMDETFHGDGFRAYFSIDGLQDASFNAVTLLPRHPQLLLDQGFVAAGQIEVNDQPGVYDGLIARVLQDSSLDESFNSNGNNSGYLIDTIGNNLVLNDIEKQYNGSITVAGTLTNVNDSRVFFISRYLKSGDRDTEAFNAPLGYTTIDMDPGSDTDEANALAFFPARIIVAGSSERDFGNPGDFDYSVAGLLIDRIFADGVETDD